MFCQFCGTHLAQAVLSCPSCGRAASASAPPPAQIGQQVRESSRDALAALRALLVDPVTNLPTTYAQLGQQRARAAGIALMAAFAVVAALGFTLGARRWLGPFAQLGASSGLLSFLKIFVAMLVPPAALAGVGYGLRRLLRSAETSPAADAFTTGAALAPAGLAVLLAGMLGLGNAEIAALLLLFASTYLVLMLFRGLTTIGRLSERAGAPLVPVLLVFASWLSKVVFTALF